jgi:hypothetical protein
MNSGKAGYFTSYYKQLFFYHRLTLMWFLFICAILFIRVLCGSLGTEPWVGAFVVSLPRKGLKRYPVYAAASRRHKQIQAESPVPPHRGRACAHLFHTLQIFSVF